MNYYLYIRKALVLGRLEEIIFEQLVRVLRMTSVYANRMIEETVSDLMYEGVSF